MWSLPAYRNRTSAPALALGFHCSVFKKRLSDDRTRRRVEGTRVHHTAGSLAGRRRKALGAARSKAGNKRWCQPAPSFRAPRSVPRGQPACGARSETSEPGSVSQTVGFEVGGGSNKASSAASGAWKRLSQPSRSARRIGWPSQGGCEFRAWMRRQSSSAGTSR